MIDLTKEKAGSLGKDTWFSDLFFAAMQARLTGSLVVKASNERTVFFRDGQPIHARDSDSEASRLGDILLESGACTQEVIDAALKHQLSFKKNAPSLGTILRERHDLSEETIEASIAKQIELRLNPLFGQTEGEWEATDSSEDLAQVAVVTAPGPFLVNAIKRHASSQELRSASTAVLGKAIAVKTTPGFLKAIDTEAVVRTLKYLRKPRKADQLERAVGDRRLVRALLRILLAHEALELSPQARAVPILKATRLTSPADFLAPSGTGPRGEDTSGSEPQSPSHEALKKDTPKPKPTSGKQISDSLIREVKDLHASLERKSHFDLLRVKEDVAQDTLRKTMTELAKKYHPDVFSGDVPEEIQSMVETISARINEAYETLSDPESRANYLAMLSDDRIQGDARRAARLKDAEVKAQMGTVMLKKRNYQKAREYLAFALEADPDSSEYKTDLAWAMFSDPKFDRDEANKQALELLQQAVQKPTKVAKQDALTHYYLGRVLKAHADKAEEALSHFKRAARLDPKNTEATREVRLMETREKKKEEKQSNKGLSRLFKR